ncbi:hypothetical protein [Brevibacillus laterosporus]|nr:hypothetical protein [Brevibacillus laterosporus]
MKLTVAIAPKSSSAAYLANNMVASAIVGIAANTKVTWLISVAK